MIVNIGPSTKFSKEEIDETMNCVKKKFKDFNGCNLTALWYDEEKSNDQVRGDNEIMLLSNFTVDASGGDGSLNPNSVYADWKWVLIRDSCTGKWRVDEYGYG